MYYVACTRSTFKVAIAQILEKDPQAFIAYVRNLPNILHVKTSVLNYESLIALPGVAHVVPMEIVKKTLEVSACS